MRALLPFCALALSGCLLDPEIEIGGPGGDDPGPLPRISVENVMGNFELAHDSKDIALYADCLHRDYQFFLTSEDAQANNLSFLDKEADVLSTETMFNEPSLVSIDFTQTQLQDSRCWDDGTCTSSVDSEWAEIPFHVSLLLSYQAHSEWVDGRALLSFHRDPATDLVSIIRVEDRTGIR